MMHIKQWQPTPEEKELYEDLGQVISGILLSYEKWRDSMRRLPRGNRIAATSSLFLAARQADGIRQLVNSNKLDSALILLRSLIETYINCAYICIGEGSANMVRFMFNGDKDSLDNTEKYRSFVQATYTKPKYTPEMFDELIRKYEAAIGETARLGQPLKKLPSLRQRVEEIIQTTGCPDFGELYFNSYLLLCDATHSAASNLAEISYSPDFETRWLGRDLGRTRDTLSVTIGALCSMFYFIEKNVHIANLTTNPILTRKLLRKYNRYVEYAQLGSNK